jgi:signal transduction histidine kinase
MRRRTSRVSGSDPSEAVDPLLADVRALPDETNTVVRRRLEAQLQQSAVQWASVVRFGQHALAGWELPLLFDEAVATTATALDLECCALLEVGPRPGVFVIRACVGGNRALVGQTITLAADALETRAVHAAMRPTLGAAGEEHPLFAACPPAFAIAIAIPAPERPFGVLAAYGARSPASSSASAHFAHMIATILAQAIAREGAERERMETATLAATGQIAAMVAHEINNPLAGIKNSFLLIKDAVPESHPHHAYVGRIEKEIDRISGIVRQMFSLYQPAARGPCVCGVDETVQDVVALLAAAARHDDVTLDAALGGRIAVEMKHEGALRQVLFNVVQNAVEASPPGGIVHIRAEVVGRVAAITVADEGAGIDQRIRARIFEPFFSSKTGRTTSGLGLGLSISKQLVNAAGGELHLESGGERGTVCRITLPLADGVPGG